jgi:hypothetical protein
VCVCGVTTSKALVLKAFAWMVRKRKAVTGSTGVLSSQELQTVITVGPSVQVERKFVVCKKENLLLMYLKVVIIYKASLAKNDN